MLPGPAWTTLPVMLPIMLAVILAVMLAGALALGWAALAQSPPDLRPKLTGNDRPLAGGTAEECSNLPKPRDPPRAPAVPDGAMSTPPASSPAASVPR